MSNLFQNIRKNSSSSNSYDSAQKSNGAASSQPSSAIPISKSSSSNNSSSNKLSSSYGNSSSSAGNNALSIIGIGPKQKAYFDVHFLSLSFTPDTQHLLLSQAVKLPNYIDVAWTRGSGLRKAKGKTVPAPLSTLVSNDMDDSVISAPLEYAWRQKQDVQDPERQAPFQPIISINCQLQPPAITAAAAAVAVFGNAPKNNANNTRQYMEKFLELSIHEVDAKGKKLRSLGKINYDLIDCLTGNNNNIASSNSNNSNTFHIHLPISFTAKAEKRSNNNNSGNNNAGGNSGNVASDSSSSSNSSITKKISLREGLKKALNLNNAVDVKLDAILKLIIVHKDENAGHDDASTGAPSNEDGSEMDDTVDEEITEEFQVVGSLPSSGRRVSNGGSILEKLKTLENEATIANEQQLVPPCESTTSVITAADQQQIQVNNNRKSSGAVIPPSITVSVSKAEIEVQTNDVVFITKEEMDQHHDTVASLMKKIDDLTRDNQTLKNISMERKATIENLTRSSNNQIEALNRELQGINTAKETLEQVNKNLVEAKSDAEIRFNELLQSNVDEKAQTMKKIDQLTVESKERQKMLERKVTEREKEIQMLRIERENLDNQVKNLQKVSAEQLIHIEKQHKEHTERNNILLSITWGLIAAITAMFAVPFMYKSNMFAASIDDTTGVSLDEFVARRSFSMVLAFAFLTYCGMALGRKFKLVSNLFSLFNMKREVVLEQLKSGAVWGVSMGFILVIVNAITRFILEFWHPVVTIVNASTAPLWTKLLYALYEAVVKELFGRFFLLTLCLHLTNSISRYALQALSQQQPGTISRYKLMLLNAVKRVVFGKQQITSIGEAEKNSIHTTAVYVSSLVYALVVVSTSIGYAPYTASGLLFWLVNSGRVLAMQFFAGLSFAYFFFVNTQFESVIVAHFAMAAVQCLLL